MAAPAARLPVARLLGLALVVALATTRPGAAQTLGSYSVVADGTTASGISSGAYMAVQLHVTHSATVSGAGAVAGGPYHCAGGGYPFNMLRALNVCMDFEDWVPFLGPPDPQRSIDAVGDAFADGEIDDPANLSDDRVLLFSGTEDHTVPQAVVKAVPVFYQAFVPAANIRTMLDVAAGHAMVTEDFGGPCAVTEPPYINDCDVDLAGDILHHLYAIDPGTVDPGTPDPGSLLPFDQAAFIDSPDAYGTGDRGFVYVPAACAAGGECRLHVAFHGCQQYDGANDAPFPIHAGYNRWAEALGIIVLYPQAAPSFDNPRGCWDWWGFTSSDYDTRDGRQIAAVKGMIDRITGD